MDKKQKNKTVKLTDVEIKAFEDLQLNERFLQKKLGQLTRQLWQIEDAIKMIRTEELIEHKKTEQEFIDNIQKVYGNGKLDTETFEFTKE